MTPEEHRMLVETRDLALENAKILRSMQRSARIGTAFRVIYWGVIIALSFGAYYLIQPYVNTLKGSLGDIGGASSGQDSSIGSALKNLKEITNYYK